MAAFRSLAEQHAKSTSGLRSARRDQRGACAGELVTIARGKGLKKSPDLAMRGSRRDKGS